jgi:two-component system chemotaxis response regulator CheY
MRDTLKELLVPHGYDVIEAENGEEGLDMLGQHQVDLVISDLNMPGMDGLTMCGHMKAQGYHIPIFILTTQTSPELKAQAKENGVVAWIVKPHKADILLNGIQKVLSARASAAH